jgi:hypothetical protein
MTKEEAQTFGLIWLLTFLLSFATFDIHFLTFFFLKQTVITLEATFRRMLSLK